LPEQAMKLIVSFPQVPVPRFRAAHLKDRFYNFHRKLRFRVSYVVTFPSLVVSNIACHPWHPVTGCQFMAINGLVRSSSWA